MFASTKKRACHFFAPHVPFCSRFGSTCVFRSVAWCLVSDISRSCDWLARGRILCSFHCLLCNSNIFRKKVLLAPGNTEYLSGKPHVGLDRLGRLASHTPGLSLPFLLYFSDLISCTRATSSHDFRARRREAYTASSAAKRLSDKHPHHPFDGTSGWEKKYCLLVFPASSGGASRGC